MRRIQRKRWLVMSLAILLPILVGMGSSGSGGSSDKIPVPAKKFQAVVIDQMDVVTDLQDVSIEGGTFLEGKKGEGIFTVAFEKIQTVTFLANEGRLTGEIRTRDGGVLTLSVPKSKKVFGRTSYGTFQISLGDLKKMTINHR